MTKVFLIAGEHSGDVLGEGLMMALKERGVTEFNGIGGPLMEGQGLESLWPMEELCVMGLWEIAGQLPRLIKLIDGVVGEIEKYDPDVVVTIDLPDFNFEVAKRLKKRGKCKARVIHYVAPSVWAWRPGRAKKIRPFLNGIMCLFPFEPPYFRKVGLKTEFVGHPMVEENAEAGDGADLRRRLEIPEGAVVIGAMFGSRPKELDMHAKVILETLSVIHEQYPNLYVIAPTVPNLEYEVKQKIDGSKYKAYVITAQDEKWNAFKACDLAIAVSGTVCLELAYAGVPHVSIYKMHPLTWIAVKLLVKTKYTNLANILLGEQVVPEFLQGRCNTLAVTREVLKMLKFEEERKKQIEKIVRIPDMLAASQDKSPSEMAADFVLKAAAAKKK